ncbi:MAG: FtsX-like permease family protein [Bauldia sp.]|uniref:ABC transporter permease n=1 Tax=Bauldia sp. TaxID=2575872 RepID=UPI001DE118D3|nr:FtsX-like permease family protein [Bauldia sp.]MCB1496273.1 FtsX-like permease family protein [Bauldia sp.]
MGALDIKLFRDLKRLWAQAIAIALVLACGVATLILAVGTFRSLEETRDAYYERYKFGDIFATAVRVPDAKAREIAEIDGVAAVEPRIFEVALLDVEGFREPATGLIVSVPPSGELAVNDLFIRRGRLPEPGRVNEVAIDAKFAEAQRFSVGSRFDAILGSAKTTLTVVGIVMSPEYVYSLGPGDMMPDSRRLADMWMPEETLASLYDLDGAFNSVSVRLLRDANETAVIEAIDDLLEPYGGTGAVARKDQVSNAFLQGELDQLQGMARIIPPIFLLVSAFLINMILSRLIELEREQIGLLKALGYGRTAVAWHYLKLVLVIAAIGVVIGAGVGTWLGRGMTVMYTRFFSFPFLVFRSDVDIYLIAAGVSMAAAAAGALKAIGVVFALPPAVAMRPPAPQVYRQFMGGLLGRMRLFSQVTTMALRHLVRHPVRTLLTAIGTAFAVALMGVAMGTLSSVDFMIDAVFFRTERQDATLAFSSERPGAAYQAVLKLPGVMAAEPYLDLPVEIGNGQYSRQLSIIGKPARTDLSRVLDLDLDPVVLPSTGLALGDRVADILRLRPGDLARVTFLDGQRRTVEVPVTQVIQSYIGLMMFMDIDALARLSGTGPRISGVHLLIDDSQLDALYRAVKETPQIAAVALQSRSRQRFQETMRENMSMMLTVYLTLSIVIAFGVVYNSARIQLSERGRELATLRVLGFHRAEVSNVLFIEIGAIVAIAQPIGWLIATGLGLVITESLATDMFRVPFVIEPGTFAISSIVVVIAALISALIVRRRIDALDLVRVLKTRE